MSQTITYDKPFKTYEELLDLLKSRKFIIDDEDFAINTLKNNLPIDIISINIKDALENLGNITGENVSENIINEIFNKFCLGK